MQKIKIITALVFPIAILLLWISILIIKVLTMPEVTLRIAGYDPRDLIGGHYIAYTIDWENTDCTQFDENKCPIDEFKYFARQEYWGEQYRFYIPEKYAAKLDRLFRFNRENHIFEIIYKFKSGLSPIARQLLIDGKPWQEAVNKENGGKDEGN